MKSVLPAILSLGVSSVALALAPAAAERTIRNHFDSDAAMRPPAFFEFAVLGVSSEADWMVLTVYNPPSTPNQVTQTRLDRTANSIAAALRNNATFQDGALSVSMRPGSGTGGLVFRMAGEKDFVVLLVDLKTGEARLSSSSEGLLSEIARSKAELGSVDREREWGVLSLEATGPKITARWNDKPLLSGNDPAPVPGRTGLATAGPGTTAFDEFVIKTAGAP